MTTNHTPRPWKVGQYLGSLRQFVIHMDVGDRGRGSDVAFTSTAFGNDETIANARLIAAAPDLLEALREIMPFTATSAIGCHGEKCREPWCHSCNGEEEAEEAAQKGCDAWAKARAAIAKATGEQP